MTDRATCHDHDQSYWVDDGCPVCNLVAELAQARAETDEFRMCVNCGLVVPASHDRAQPGPACEAPDACTFDLTPREAWEYWRAKAHQARADAQAAVALVAERAAAEADPWDGPVTKNKIVDAQAIVAQQVKARIRALAPVDGLAEVAKLRAVANSANQHWLDKLDAEADRDRLAAELAEERGELAFMGRTLQGWTQHDVLLNHEGAYRAIKIMADRLAAVQAKEE